MGEYAIRKKDRQEIKIGTCENMAYIRFDQLGQVEYKYGWLNCFFRIPLPSEDGIEPGDYNWSLLNKNGYIPCDLMVNEDEMSDELKADLSESTGTIQMTQNYRSYGLLVNVKCHHGFKLPEASADFKPFWNGKAHHLMFSFLKPTEKELRVGLSCAACGQMWSLDFEESAPLFHSLWLKLRVFHQCSEYYLKRNGDTPDYSVTYKDERDVDITIRPSYVSKDKRDQYSVEIGEESIEFGNWQEMRDLFISRCKDDSFTYDLKKHYLKKGGVDNGTD